MKKEILVAISVAGVLFGLSVSLAAQEKLSLAQCREMALKYNKDMAAANKQTEAARLMSLSYKANFFPSFTVNGTGIYSTADGSLGVPGGNLPVFLPNPATGELVSSGFAYFPGLNLDYKVGTIHLCHFRFQISQFDRCSNICIIQKQIPTRQTVRKYRRKIRNCLTALTQQICALIQSIRYRCC